jgi:hypothetical protein
MAIAHFLSLKMFFYYVHARRDSGERPRIITRQPLLDADAAR